MPDDSKWNKKKMQQKENGTEEKNAIVFDGYVCTRMESQEGRISGRKYVIQGRSNSLGSGDSAVGYHQKLDSTQKMETTRR